MKKHVLLGLFATIPWLLVAQTATDSVGKVDNLLYKEFDVAAVFPGCGQMDAASHERLVCASELLHNFIYDNLQYPEAARQSKTQGIVVVNFVVEKDGAVSNCKIANFLDQSCNQEALRIVQSMPAWLPAEVKGAKVRSEVSMAVRFKLLQDGTVYRPPFVAPKPKEDNIPIFESIGSNPKAAEPKKMDDGNEKLEAQVLSDSILGDKIYKLADIKPLFPGCGNIEDLKERTFCAETNMLKYVYSNVKYPPKARKEGIEGKVYVSFVIGKDGAVYMPKIIKGIGGGCDEEALRVVSMMPKWEPGIRNGHPVNVTMNLPVQFKL